MMTADLASIVAIVLLVAIACVGLPHRSLLLRERQCPRCGPRASMERRPRSASERLLDRVVTCRRYQCLTCGWQGLIRDKAARRSGETPGTSEHELQVFQATAPTRRARPG